MISGATPRQLFWKVKMPAARAQMLLGVNQTTMASLSMVIIASIIGGTNDIGWEVLSTIRKAQFGESLLAGFVIALIAMILDRVTYGFAMKDRASGPQAPTKLWLITAVVMAGLWVLSLVTPFLGEWPKALVFDPADRMNSALEYVLVNGRVGIETLKNSAFFFVMLLLKISPGKAISPFSWGFTLTTPIIAGYCIAALGLAGWAFSKGRMILAALTLLSAVFLYVGLTNVAWVALVGTLVFASYVIAGRNLAIGTALGLLFLIIAGIWTQTVLLLNLCGLGVLICFIVGTAIGVWASESAIVSAITRPIIDRLQTMPLFVVLIPFVMIFKIGAFTALLAVIAYAIGMLVIAALVGTNGWASRFTSALETEILASE